MLDRITQSAGLGGPILVTRTGQTAERSREHVGNGNKRQDREGSFGRLRLASNGRPVRTLLRIMGPTFWHESGFYARWWGRYGFQRITRKGHLSRVPSLADCVSGRYNFLVRKRGLKVMVCDWLVRVPSGHPEPDSPADLWREVECGLPLVVNEFGSYRCEAGHEMVSYADPAFDAWQAELAFQERMEN